MTTLLTLPGYNPLAWFKPFADRVQKTDMQRLLKGEPAAAADRIVPVNYQNWVWPPGGSDDGRDTLDRVLRAELTSSDNDVVVLGHSYGSESIIKWLASDFEPVDPARVSFILLGTTPWMRPVLEESRTPYRVTVATRQYDMWADPPNVQSSEFYGKAVENTREGEKRFGTHLHYDVFSLNDLHWEGVSGNVTYMLFETPVALRDGTTREQIETAYNRPHLNASL
jgi:hypothetical protein